MTRSEDLYKCRVCGLQQDDFPWGENGNTPSFNICDCCGSEFGYEDMTPQAIKNARDKWLAQGAVWFNRKAKPTDWVLGEQLCQIPAPFQNI